MKKTKKLSDYNKFLIYNPGSNQEVTTFYCKIIADSLKEFGIEVKRVDRLIKDKANKTFGVLVVRTSDAWLAKRCHFGYIMTWIQGIAPEEVWLTQKSILRYVYIWLLEVLGLWSSDFIFYCSEKMRQHYRKKYLIKSKRYYVMPCFNEELDSGEILSKDYSKNIFTYAGGLDKWQSFERTVDVFKTIENIVPNCVFRVYARDKELATKILDQKGVKNYKVAYLSQEELKKELKEAKFGFCIRDNIEVNKVATPTKLSNYVAEGIIPIFSMCLDSFYKQSKDNEYALCIDNKDFLSSVEELCSTRINNSILLKTYQDCYSNYYSKSYHKREMIKLFKNNDEE